MIYEWLCLKLQNQNNGMNSETKAYIVEKWFSMAEGLLTLEKPEHYVTTTVYAGRRAIFKTREVIFTCGR